MLVLVLLGLVAFVDAADNTKQCPTGCNCDVSSSDKQLIVSCGIQEVDREQFVRQLDVFLSADHFLDRLTSLRITRTPMTRLPASVCQLLNLRTLNLDGNKLSELPDNCLTNMTKLDTLNVSKNSITGLQDGIFDGLQSLVTLDVSHNLIAVIGLRVFSSTSVLTNLRSLDLSYNKLMSLEPWWIPRSRLGSITSPVIINLSRNLISKFTNKLQYIWTCDMTRIQFGLFDLDGNPIAHIMDIFTGWNCSIDDFVRCYDKVQEQKIALIFSFRGFNLACDCVDYEIFKMARNRPLSTMIPDARCNKNYFLNNTTQSVLVSAVPLSDFVCDLSDHCPSSCQCVYRPDNFTLHVYCSAANFSSLPLDMPPLPKSDVKYKLDFSNNKLFRRLEHRPYFVNTSILDVSNCSLTEITMVDWQDLSLFSVANLRENLLQSFPSQSSTLNISAKLLLGLNPWRCSCDKSWMIQWLQSLSGQILDPGDILCRYPSRLYGRNVLQLTEIDFCFEPSVPQDWRTTLPFIAAIFAVLVMLIIVGILLYKLRGKCYRKWKFHPFDRDECVGEHMDYDLFLCCSSEDHRPHARRILQQTESNGYRVCYHERDFLPGSLITDCMINSIERSKRTVCLISNNFLRR